MNENTQQGLSSENDPKNYLSRQDGCADLTFCETFFGYTEEILADILRQENSLDILSKRSKAIALKAS